MILRRLLVVLAILAACTQAHAQGIDRRSELRAAFDAAEAGQLDLGQAARFSRDPLYPWLQATILRKQIATAAPAQIQGVLAGLGEQPAGRWLRSAWLNELAKREDWRSFRADYRGSEDLGLRCADLRARMDLAPADDGAWIADAKRLWLTGEALPRHCDPPMARLAQIGQLDEALRWQRVDLADAGGEVGLIRFIAQGLATEAAQLAQSYADYIAAPGDGPTGLADAARAAARWPRSRLSRLAKRDPGRAQLLLERLPAPALDDAQRGRVAYQVALWTVASYLPGSADRLNAVPRIGLRRPAARMARARSHQSQRQRRGARRDRKDGQTRSAATRAGSTSKPGCGSASANPTPHARFTRRPRRVRASMAGWPRIACGQRYSLCPLEPATDAASLKRVTDDAGLARALDLFAIERPEPAAREWCCRHQGAHRRRAPRSPSRRPSP